ncbi:gliding motility-associated C-terminal domain-containing protein [Chitinophaga sp.]|uniref:T9SS type B sorting domain-containing protein n=1 Tax=Chitinophaga sp. TaxID=1869181 RepID=UPI0031D9621F
MSEQNKLLVNRLLLASLLLFVSKVSPAQCTTDPASGTVVSMAGVYTNDDGDAATRRDKENGITDKADVLHGIENVAVSISDVYANEYGHATTRRDKDNGITGKADVLHGIENVAAGIGERGTTYIAGAATSADIALATLRIAKTTDGAEPATNGAVVISMAAGYTAGSNITVSYTVAGTAMNGTDYKTLSGTVVIPAGANSITLPIDVIDNFKIDGTRTVTLTLVSGTDGTSTFLPGNDYTTTVNITDNDVASFQAWKVASLPATSRDGKVQPGEIITYKIYVRNTSNAAIGPLTVTDKIPANTNWESGWQLSSGVVGLPITTIPAGGLVEVTFQVKTYENLDGVDWINNTAYVSDGINKLPTYACDPKTGTCDTITRVPVRASRGDLSITKMMAAEGPFMIDDYITYKMVVKNFGNSTFTNLVMTDSLPYNLDVPNNTTTTKGSVATSLQPKKVTWSVSELLPGDSVVVTFTSRIMSGEEVFNTAYVVANEGEDDYSNNIAINKEAVIKKDLFFINAFRPGGVQNNRFVIVGIENYPSAHLLVYSRLGNVVYESSKYNNDWGGDNLSTGEYIYKVIVPKKAGKVTYTGTVLIIR